MVKTNPKQNLHLFFSFDSMPFALYPNSIHLLSTQENTRRLVEYVINSNLVKKEIMKQLQWKENASLMTASLAFQIQPLQRRGDLITIPRAAAVLGLRRESRLRHGNSEGLSRILPLTIERKKLSFGLLTPSLGKGQRGFRQIWKTCSQMSLLKSRPQGVGIILLEWLWVAKILHHPLAQGLANFSGKGQIGNIFCSVGHMVHCNYSTLQW